MNNGNKTDSRITKFGGWRQPPVTLAIKMASLRILELLAVFSHIANVNFGRTLNLDPGHTEGYSCARILL